MDPDIILNLNKGIQAHREMAALTESDATEVVAMVLGEASSRVLLKERIQHLRHSAPLDLLGVGERRSLVVLQQSSYFCLCIILADIST